MQKINSQASLRAAILELESKQAEEGKLLKEQFLLAFESVKPINLIKNTFKEVTDSWDLKENTFKSTVALVSKIVYEVVTNTPIKKLLGNALIYGIAKVVEKNPEIISTLGGGFLKTIWNKFGKKVEETDTKKPFNELDDIFE